jgi:tRNA (adenine37-N6)-methyltransferase
MEHFSKQDLQLKPIGFVRCGKQVKFEALHQPNETATEINSLELLPGHSFEQALQDLKGFSRIWLLWWFHRNETWKPLVQPPRGPKHKRGVFATRSPHRPNALGLTPVQLLEIKGRTLFLGPSDLIDGTPVFDIKPYIPAYDAFPNEKSGWTGEMDALYARAPEFEVEFSALANEQALWLLQKWNIDFRPRIVELLQRDPLPQRTRRIKKHSGGAWMIGCGAWRAVFEVTQKLVQICSLEPGFPLRFLIDEGRAGLPDQEAQLDFLKHWPEQTAAAVTK